MHEKQLTYDADRAYDSAERARAAAAIRASMGEPTTEGFYPEWDGPAVERDPREAAGFQRMLFMARL